MYNRGISVLNTHSYTLVRGLTCTQCQRFSSITRNKEITVLNTAIKITNLPSCMTYKASAGKQRYQQIELPHLQLLICTKRHNSLLSLHIYTITQML